MSLLNRLVMRVMPGPGLTTVGLASAHVVVDQRRDQNIVRGAFHADRELLALGHRKVEKYLSNETFEKRPLLPNFCVRLRF